MVNENIAPACGIDSSLTRVQFMYDAINASSLTLGSATSLFVCSVNDRI